MKEMIELTHEEAEALAREVVDSGGMNFDDIPLGMQFNMIGGAVNIVLALQTLGWRLTRPTENQ